MELTREMLASAQAQEWERLAELEKSRLPLFHQVFEHIVSDNEPLAREVLAIDKQIMALAQSVLPALQGELQSLKVAGKANTAYQAVQRLASAQK